MIASALQLISVIVREWTAQDEGKPNQLSYGELGVFYRIAVNKRELTKRSYCSTTTVHTTIHGDGAL